MIIRDKADSYRYPIRSGPCAAEIFSEIGASRSLDPYGQTHNVEVNHAVPTNLIARNRTFYSFYGMPILPVLSRPEVKFWLTHSPPESAKVFPLVLAKTRAANKDILQLDAISSTWYYFCGDESADGISCGTKKPPARGTFQIRHVAKISDFTNLLFGPYAAYLG